MASRQELQRRLATLVAVMPEMKRLHPDYGDFICEFLGHADFITDAATDGNVDWAFQQVDDILDKHGFRPESMGGPPGA